MGTLQGVFVTDGVDDAIDRVEEAIDGLAQAKGSLRA
jgi:hypothetical protein